MSYVKKLVPKDLIGEYCLKGNTLESLTKTTKFSSLEIRKNSKGFLSLYGINRNGFYKPVGNLFNDNEGEYNFTIKDTDGGTFGMTLSRIRIENGKDIVSIKPKAYRQQNTSLLDFGGSF